MGVHANISYDKFPKQSDTVGKEIKVIFNYETEKQLKGKVLRDDIEDPFIMLIQLEDERVIMSCECQYTFK